MTGPGTPPGKPVNLARLADDLREEDARFRRDFAIVDAPPPPPMAGRADLVERLLAAVTLKTGITVETTLRRKVEGVLASVDDALFAAWVAMLEAAPADDPEWLSFVENLTVHETFFHRHPEQLDGLLDVVLTPLAAERRRHARPAIRAWSTGCSTGEEAYTLAFLIVEALARVGEASVTHDAIRIAPGWRIEVVGADISQQALRQARDAVYPDFPTGPFRAMPARCDVFFTDAAPDADIPWRRRRVRPEIADLVEFRHVNLAADGPPATQLDVVLCRNVLIYFAEDARRRAQEALCDALAPGGHLALGPTDTLKPTDRFETRWLPDAVLYRKR